MSMKQPFLGLVLALSIAVEPAASAGRLIETHLAGISEVRVLTATNLAPTNGAPGDPVEAKAKISQTVAKALSESVRIAGDAADAILVIHVNGVEPDANGVFRAVLVEVELRETADLRRRPDAGPRKQGVRVATWRDSIVVVTPGLELWNAALEALEFSTAAFVEDIALAESASEREASR